MPEEKPHIWIWCLFHGGHTWARTGETLFSSAYAVFECNNCPAVRHVDRVKIGHFSAADFKPKEELSCS
jgi:hypothetical protein